MPFDMKIAINGGKVFKIHTLSIPISENRRKMAFEGTTELAHTTPRAVIIPEFTHGPGRQSADIIRMDHAATDSSLIIRIDYMQAGILISSLWEDSIKSQRRHPYASVR